ncbi:hypothetical protein C8R41DRAFT_500853 [Lentinula lateritia]|uniref:Uncharacterized protein n=1 Tax=Lentinula lateritia TaxID=40482 RepID=A0ABQ8V8H6_9AGAR|nr:hypothetical protein C8R41DRAFT_500853 [Lentinula lateritia]
MLLLAFDLTNILIAGVTYIEGARYPIQHFQRTDYAPGPIYDCNSPYCAVSNAHTHTSPCNCSQRIAIRERIVNQFYTICDNCKRIELDRRVGRR